MKKDTRTAWGQEFDRRMELSLEMRQLKARIAELEANPWISVADRLPDNNDIYLVYPSDNFYVSFYGAAVEKFAITTLYKIDVTHWMPLPASPKQED